MAKKIKKRTKKEDKIEQYKQDIKADSQEREKDVTEGLAQLYQDENGEIINVKEVRIKKKNKHFGLLTGLIYIAIFVIVFYAIYFFVNRNSAGNNIDFLIEAEKEQTIGKEFVYTVKYQNLDRVALNNITIKLDYPDDFVFLDSEPMPDQRNDVWKIDRLEPHHGGEIKIKGKMIGKVDSSELILGEIYYMPDNFSSEFKQTADLETTITNQGINLEVIPPATLFVNEPETLTINYSSPEPLLDNFKLEVIPTDPENIKFISATLEDGKDSVELAQAEPWVWGIGDIGSDPKSLKIKFAVKARTNNSEFFKVKISYQNKDLVKIDDPIFELETPLKTEWGNNETIITKSAEPKTEDTDNQGTVVGISDSFTALLDQKENLDINQNKEYYLFYEQDFEVEIVQNDLNLTFLVDGESRDKSVDFGNTLKYEISYDNKGKADLNNVIVMAVLEGESLDWGSLETNGKVDENMIVWTPEEAKELKKIVPGDSGKLSFQIKVKSFEDAGKKSAQIKGYAQFNTYTENEDGKKETDTKKDNNVSNTLIVKINSDLSLNEELRYYTSDNLAVGTGPLPPKVGQTTTFKAYWRIDNSLHNLKRVQVSTDLPDNVKWNGKEKSNVGRLRYDQYDHRIIWEIDEVNVFDEEPIAEFSISLTPTTDDADKIMILLNGTKIVAMDTETNENITKTNKAKTTKLEDDTMIEHDGVVKN